MTRKDYSLAELEQLDNDKLWRIAGDDNHPNQQAARALLKCQQTTDTTSNEDVPKDDTSGNLDDDRNKKEIRRDMACEDPEDNPAILVYRAIYERDYGERPWEDG